MRYVFSCFIMFLSGLVCLLFFVLVFGFVYCSAVNACLSVKLYLVSASSIVIPCFNESWNAVNRSWFTMGLHHLRLVWVLGFHRHQSLTYGEVLGILAYNQIHE